MDSMPKPKPPHLVTETTRHGKRVWFVRIGHGRRIRIKGDYGTQEFFGNYRAALEELSPESVKAPSRHTLEWLVREYTKSPHFDTYKKSTRDMREAIFNAAIAKSGNVRASTIAKIDIQAAVDARTPNSAKNFIKAMRPMFRWAVKRDYVSSDPTEGVDIAPVRSKGFHTWTVDEVLQYHDSWPVGTRERLALDLLLYTGLRRSDVVLLGRQHIKGDQIEFRSGKTDVPIYRPLLDVLMDSIEATQTGDLTFLVRQDGRSFSSGNSFGNWFGGACRTADVPGRSHGLRKAGATLAAENGATDKQLDALYGWTSGKMSTLYTREADRARLSHEAAKLINLDGKSRTSNRESRTSKNR